MEEGPEAAFGVEIEIGIRIEGIRNLRSIETAIAVCGVCSWNEMDGEVDEFQILAGEHVTKSVTQIHQTPFGISTSLHAKHLG
jgi:hypothetical protein